MPANLCVHAAQIMVRAAEVRIRLDGPLQLGNGTVVLAGVIQRDPEVRADGRGKRIHLQRPAIVLERFVEPSFLDEKLGVPMMRARVVRAQLERPLVFPLGARQVPVAILNQQRHGRMRVAEGVVDLERLPDDADGFSRSGSRGGTPSISRKAYESASPT